MCPSNSEGHTQRPETSMRRATTSGHSTIWPAFQVLDADCDGRISLEDLRTVFYSGFPGAEEEDLGPMISAADSNEDGFVEFDEFERVLGCGGAGGFGMIMGEVFRAMDGDGDGKVGFRDLKEFLSTAGFSASDDDIRAMIGMSGGGRGDGGCEGVSFEALLNILSVDQ